MGTFDGPHAADNILLIVIGVIISIICLLYFGGYIPSLFMDLERLNPNMNHNKVARVNSCLTKYKKEFDKFGLTHKCIWNHPCSNIKNEQLCNFWICSSWKSYLPCNHKNDYASIDGIIHCLQMGARYIELDIFNKNMCPYTEPIVLNGSTPGRYQYSSGLDLESCCEAIYEYGMLSTPFRNKDGADPLFVCFNLHLEGNWHTLTKVSAIIKKTFGMKLLPKKWPFRTENLGELVNLGKLELIKFQDKIVIITNVHVEYHDQLKLSRMNEVVDICFKDLSIGQPYKYPLDVDESTVIPRASEWLHNYSYEEIENEPSINLNQQRLIRVYPTPVKSVNREFDVMQPKNIANNWALTMFAAGKGAPQFCLMDFSSTDDNLKEYLAFFFGVDDNEDIIRAQEIKDNIHDIREKKKDAMAKWADIRKKKRGMRTTDRTKCNMEQRLQELQTLIRQYNYALSEFDDGCDNKGVIKGFAIALKPKELRVKPLDLAKTPEQNPEYSAARRNAVSPHGQFPTAKVDEEEDDS